MMYNENGIVGSKLGGSVMSDSAHAAMPPMDELVRRINAATDRLIQSSDVADSAMDRFFGLIPKNNQTASLGKDAEAGALGRAFAAVTILEDAVTRSVAVADRIAGIA